MLGEEAILSKALYLSGKRERRCGGHKWESKRALPGEVLFIRFAQATIAVRR